MAKSKSKSKPKAKDKATTETLTYEQALGELEALIERIEQGEIGLEQSLTEYRRGAALLKRCRSILDTAEQQIDELTADERFDD
jgi:exodeoxyribonuclease VII small subunit